jgi:hypothetical protein
MIIAVPLAELKDSLICTLLIFTNIVGALIIIHVKKNNFSRSSVITFGHCASPAKTDREVNNVEGDEVVTRCLA